MARTFGRESVFLALIGALAGCSYAPAAAGPDYVRSTAGAFVLAAPPAGTTVRIGSKPLLNEADAAAADDHRAADPARGPTPRGAIAVFDRERTGDR